MRDACVVGEEPRQFARFISRPVPDDIAAAVAFPQIAVRAGHRIEQALLAGRQGKCHRFEQLAMDRGRNGALRQQCAPRAIAGVERDSVRQALAAHRRAQAVGADQHVAFGARAVGEPRDDARLGLIETREPAATVIVRRRKGVAQHPVDAFPGGQDLRALRGQYGAALDVEEFPRACRYAEIAGVEPERGEPRDQFGLRHDAGTAAVEFALDALVNVDGKAAPPQHDGGQKPAHRAADHQRAPLPCHSAGIQPFSITYFKIRGGFLYSAWNPRR